MKPVARKSGLVVRDLADEVVVYDTERHEAHCLNRTAAAVFRHADGQRDVSDLAALLGPDGIPGAEGFVEMALAQLEEAHLLENAPLSGSEPGLARRDAMRRVGLGAAILLPLVTSVLAPSPAEAAASCLIGPGACGGQPDGTPCTCGPGPTCTSTCFGGSCLEGPC